MATARAQKKQMLEQNTLDIALVGNPNTGKTTIFNALTGLRQKVGNYPGVTVEKKTGLLPGQNGARIRVNDLPGLYSLTPKSVDDQISIEVLTGRHAEVSNLRLVVVAVDASNLSRNLYLVTQIVELGFPVIVALNMMDIASKKGMTIDHEKLSALLKIPVIPVVANKNQGIEVLRASILEQIQVTKADPETNWEMEVAVSEAVAPIAGWYAAHAGFNTVGARAEALRVVSSKKALSVWLAYCQKSGKPEGTELNSMVEAARRNLATQDVSWEMLEAKLRYEWIDALCHRVIRRGRTTDYSLSDRIDRVLTQRIAGPIIFLVIFAVIFQSIFTWAEIPMNAIDSFVAWLGSAVNEAMPDGVLRDLIVDGVIAGVGAILVFLPQILFLFFFLSLLEDTGYMARVAFMLDRIMRSVGLSGRSVIPLLSSFACAVPGIMATRTITSSKDRLITIMVAPLMSCSARLPVYTLMIGAFIPGETYLGFFSLQGLTLLSMYVLGIAGAVGAALVFKKFLIKGRKTTFIMEMPPYRRPSSRWVLYQLYERGKIFVLNVGQIILAISVVLWFLASYPKPDAPNVTAEKAIQESFAGKIGHAIEPVIEPLGFDWKIGIGLITSFAAREVLVSTMATIYNVEGADETSGSLRDALRKAKNPETGAPVYTPLVALSLMVFFVFACQCMSTVAIVKRETNSWRWPVIMIVYMTAMAYVASLAVYQGGKLLGMA